MMKSSRAEFKLTLLIIKMKGAENAQKVLQFGIATQKPMQFLFMQNEVKYEFQITGVFKKRFIKIHLPEKMLHSVSYFCVKKLSPQIFITILTGFFQKTTKGNWSNVFAHGQSFKSVNFLKMEKESETWQKLGQKRWALIIYMVHKEDLSFAE